MLLGILTALNYIMYTCVIIDDEPHALEGLKKYVDAYPDLCLVKCYSDPRAALIEMSQEAMVDLVLLDIDMPYINGIELSREIRHKTKRLVFTTGHSKYGYDAIKVDADDYLLKPYTLAEFLISMNKVFKGFNALEGKVNKEDFFFVKSKEDNLKLINIKYCDVVAVESKLNYVMIYTKNRQVLTYMSLTEISKILEKYAGFLRFHRSFIIAQEHIEFIEGNSIRMVNGKEITVGDFYKKDYSTFLQRKLLKTGIR